MSAETSPTLQTSADTAGKKGIHGVRRHTQQTETRKAKRSKGEGL